MPSGVVIDLTGVTMLLRSRPRFRLSVLALALLAGCAAPGAREEPVPQTEPPPPTSADLESRAHELAQRLLIVDTHIDAPYRLTEHPGDLSQRSENGDFDFVRAREGRLDAAFMAIFVPAALQGTGRAKQKADDLIDLVEKQVSGQPDRVAIGRSVAEVRQNFARGLLSLALGMENGAPLEGDLENLRHFRARGVSYITLTHGKANDICDSSYDPERRWHGLSPFGREVVAEMNRLGVMVDISHVSDETFFQVIELSRAPVIASHSSCRHFTPGWERNMSDPMIEKLAQQGGVIQINFGSMFLDGGYRQRWQERHDAIEAYENEHHLGPDSEAGESFAKGYRESHPIEPVDVSAVADHIDHVVHLVGIDHVGLGSDFDGVGDSLPRGLEDVSNYPNLILELLKRGYTDDAIEKVCSGNLLRVWSEVERVAASGSRATQGTDG
jgi:membrane dipeptidase